MEVVFYDLEVVDLVHLLTDRVAVDIFVVRRTIVGQALGFYLFFVAVSYVLGVGISFWVGLWMASIVGVGNIELGIGESWWISCLLNRSLIDDCIFAFVRGDVMDDSFVFG